MMAFLRYLLFASFILIWTEIISSGRILFAQATLVFIKYSW